MRTPHDNALLLLVILVTVAFAWILTPFYGALLWGVVFAILVGKEPRLPDYIVLVSTLGGLALLGVNGLIVGPLVASMFVVTWDIYARESQEARLQLDHGLRRSRAGES